MKAVGPAPVVVTHSAGAGSGPPRRIVRRMDMTLHRLVLDALTESVDDLGSRRAHRGDILVRRTKVVAGRQRRVGIRPRKHRVQVHHRRVGVLAIMQTRRGNTQSPLGCRDIDQPVRGEWALIDAVQSAQFTVGSREVNRDTVRVIAECAECCEQDNKAGEQNTAGCHGEDADEIGAGVNSGCCGVIIPIIPDPQPVQNLAINFVP